MAAHDFDDRRDPHVKDRRASGGLRAVLVDAAKMAGRLAGGAAGVAAGAAAALRQGVPPHVDPKVEEAYWREHYAGEPYYDAMYSFEDVEKELNAEFHWNRGQGEASDLPKRDSESFIKWIPLVVPLLAVVLALLVYLIAWAVL